jgi:hypothetical protein
MAPRISSRDFPEASRPIIVSILALFFFGKGIALLGASAGAAFGALTLRWPPYWLFRSSERFVAQRLGSGSGGLIGRLSRDRRIFSAMARAHQFLKSGRSARRIA